MSALGRSCHSALGAETRPSRQVRNIGSPYEKANVRQHVAPSTAANGSKEPKSTDAAECVNGCKWQGAGFRGGAGVCADMNAQGARNSASNRCECVSENEACFQLDGFDLSSFSHKFC